MLYADYVRRKMKNTIKTLTAEAEGNPITITDGLNYKFRGLKVFGQSTQSGTPTPSVPIEIVTPTSYEVSMGKNLDNGIYRNNGYLNFTTGQFTTWANTTYACNESYIPVVGGENYTYTFYDYTHASTPPLFGILVYWYNESKTFISYEEKLWTNGYSPKFIAPSNAVYARLSYRTNVITAPIPLNVTRQFEKGSTSTPYEAYVVPQLATIPYALRGIEVPSTYIGYTYAKGGKYYVADYVYKQSGNVFKQQNIAESTTSVADAKVNTPYLGTMTANGTTDGSGAIAVKSGETIQYILATPITTDITATAEGQALFNLHTYQGTTKIYLSTAQAYMWVKYIKK